MRDANSLVELGRVLLDDAGKLVRSEIELAKEEISALIMTNVKGVGLLAAALLVALIFFIMLQVAIIETVPAGVRWIVAWAIVALWLIVAIVLALLGKSRFKFEAPAKTIDTIKGDIEWAKGQMRSSEK